MMPVPKKQKKVDNYKFAVGTGNNWVDLDKGVMYMIQEYKEALEKGERPKGIRVVSLTETILDEDSYEVPKDLGYVAPEKVEEMMKDPEPDPRYAAETPKEHRKNW